MSTLYVLMPPLSQWTDARELMGWLARGDRLPALADPRSGLARELFRFAGDALPAAALRHHCHAEDAEKGAWLAVDPAWVRSEATGARLMAWPLRDLSGEEAAQLVAALRPLFEEARFPICIDTPPAWCLRLPGAPSVPFTAPVRALGANLLDCLPEGVLGRAWRRLFNEAQVILHAHPVNAARTAKGKHPANAVWFWGAGALPDAVDAAVNLLASNDDVLCGLGRLARVEWVAPTPAAFDELPAGASVLLDLDVPRGVDRVAWLPRLHAALSEPRFGTVEFTFQGGERFRVRRSHRLRFWRRA